MQKDLTRARAKGISITFRVSQFQEIACDIHSHLAREVKINVKQIFGMFVKKEKFHPRWEFEPTTFELEVQHASPLRPGAACRGSRAISAFIFCTCKHHFFLLLSLIFFTFARR